MTSLNQNKSIDAVPSDTPIFQNIRSKGIGGSELAPILGISPYVTAYELWEQKTGRKPPPDLSGLSHIQRGKNSEVIARMKIEQQELTNFTPKMWQIPDTPYRGSDDGWSMERNIVLEIKALGKEAHQNVSKGIVPEYYLCQVQWVLFVSQAKEAWFISYRVENDEMFKVVIKPDPEYWKVLKKAVDVFWFEHVQKNIPPPLTDKDYKLVRDDKFQALAIEFKKLYADKEAIDDRLEEIKKELQDFAKDHPAVRGNGIRVRRYERKGSIDYSKIPAISNLDLEPYRRPSSSVVEVRLDALVPDL